MAARHICLIASGLLFTASAGFAVDLPDGDTAAPQVENSQYHFLGKINRNAVEVKSGPAENSYGTIKLQQDAQVKVVGIRNGWLKIEPPAGSFSYVPAAYVTRRNDGKDGRVNSKLIVKAGSSLNTMKTMPQLQLDEGQDVKIIGEQDEYFKIVPPKGAYVYVDQKYVTPIGRVDEPTQLAKKDDKKSAPQGDSKAEPKVTETPTETAEAKRDGATTEPVTGLADANEKTGEPTSRPAVAAAIEDFRAVEADFELASKKDVTEQPLEKLIERYTTLAKSGEITGTNKRILDARLAALKIRTESREKIRSFRQSKEEAQASLRDLVEEKNELEERSKATEVSLYTAVGTLRMSSLQQGGATLYRLTDPTTGRTTVYIRSNDPKYASLINQFVGVRGDLTNDQRMRMKIITPTEAEPVDASKVNTSVIATITPPGMLMSTSSSSDQQTPAAE